MNNLTEKDVASKLKELGELYPIEYSYGSRAGVFGMALSDGLISREDYNVAREHYGSLWNYAG